MRILAFIPARKGSKGIKNKNFVIFNKKPLIFSTIKFCKKLKNITTFVSTDSKKILSYAKSKGIKYDYIRPKKLSTDKSKVINSIFHALKWFQKRKIFFDAIIMLQPTAPIRKNLKSIISVTRMKEHPCECIETKGNKWNFIVKKDKKKSNRRQDYPKNFFFIDGSVYLAKVSFLKKYRTFINNNYTKIFKSSQYPGVDIDEKIDLRIANLFK